MTGKQYYELAKTVVTLARESMETRLRLTALENCLQVKDYPLFEAYAREIERLRNDKSFQMNFASLEGLQQRLLEKQVT